MAMRGNIMLFNNKKKKSLLNSRAVVNFKNTIFFVFRLEKKEMSILFVYLITESLVSRWKLKLDKTRNTRLRVKSSLFFFSSSFVVLCFTFYFSIKVSLPVLCISASLSFSFSFFRPVKNEEMVTYNRRLIFQSIFPFFFFVLR